MKLKLALIFIPIVLIAGIFSLRSVHNFTASDLGASIQEPQASSTPEKDVLPPIKVIHLPTPPEVKGLYVTLSAFQSPKLLTSLAAYAETNHLNSMVIDVYSNGKNLFDINNEKAKRLVAGLHDQNIYLIARIVTFNDAQEHKWFDPGSKERWQQVVDSSRLASDIGFDEINYDYVRYGGPSEPQSPTPIPERESVLKSFFEFLNQEVRQKIGRPISADIFGVTFINPEEGIGQHLEDVARNFDYVMPMPYPSHWAQYSFGYKWPGSEPYQVVYQSLTQGWAKVKSDPTRIAKLRPWIQAFNIESISPWKLRDYTAADIQAQIKACADADSVGWIMWNGFSRYDPTYFTAAVMFPTSTPAAENTPSTTRQ